MRRGTNPVRIGSYNQTVVLDAIRRSEGLSRVELAAVTGLSAQAVTNICRRLLADGLVREAGTTNVGRGKPRTLLRLTAAARLAVGVHLDPAVVSVALLDLEGVVLAQQRLATPSALDPPHAIAAITAAVDAVIAGGGVDRDRILGVGVAAPGPIDLRRGVVANPPNLPDWHQVPLRDDLAAATGLPVLLDKDVTAAAVAETWWGSPGRGGTMAVLYIGTGIGVGLVVDGEVVRGSSGNAGEIGHIIVDPDGPPCACGQRGCVAVTLAPVALVGRARRAGALGAGAPSDTAGALGVLFDQADAGDLAARRIVDDAAAGIARLGLVVTNMLDLDRLVLGGPYWSRLEPYYLGKGAGEVGAGTAARQIHHVKVLGTSIGEHFGAVGAASLVLDQAFSAHPTALVEDVRHDSPRARSKLA
ncbi:ROK family transcriptional regulator [Cellulomonas fimi]|uniref:ROK family transcriptional regulator n=1 Tax=Cellulomonas fimi TaxID=1708 RepID=UPI002892C23C|nr:ROK family transcriptional regulator [Cellulomonas fimi]